MLEELRKAVEQREESLEKAKYLSKKQVNGKWIYDYGNKKGIRSKKQEQSKTLQKEKADSLSLSIANNQKKKWDTAQSIANYIEKKEGKEEYRKFWDNYHNNKYTNDELAIMRISQLEESPKLARRTKSKRSSSPTMGNAWELGYHNGNKKVDSVINNNFNPGYVHNKE